MKKQTRKQTNLRSENECVDIIITTFNNEKIIRECITSVKNQTYKNFKCIVVDDCSTDNTVKIIANEYKWVKIIKQKKRSGPSINRNLAIMSSNSPYIATLDSDVVLEKKWLSEQVKLMEKDNECKIGILASKLFFVKTGKINSAGGGLKFPGIGYDIGSGEGANNFNEEMEVDYACSAAMLMRRSMINKIGMFDETYFYGHEDTDLGWRARLFGYKVIYNPKAVAYHDVNQTVKTMSEAVIFHGTKNRVRSIIKNCSFVMIPFCLSAYIVITIMQIFIRKHRLARIKGWWWNMANISDTFKERRKIIWLKRRRVL